MTRGFRRTTLVFDLDGTLVDSAPDIAAAVNALFAELSLPEVELSLIRRMIGDGAPVLLERALRHVGAAHEAADLMVRFSAHYGENAVKLTTLYPAVMETLTILRGAGCRLGVCTNKPIGPTRAVLAAFGLDELIEAVVGGDSLPQRKPEAEPLLSVIRSLGGTPESAVLIGDSAVDLACAAAAGVPAIIIPSGYGMAPPQALVTAASFADLPEAIERLTA
ncbi:MAG TPA: phosphoglycolate phosphatase [Dongiaceae bacterium]|nr:phosphoglycolate phosphatase [Dongiaceae bacterium]